MEISNRMKKTIVGALLFLVLGVSALGGFGAHQHGAANGVPAAYAGAGPPPDYDNIPREPTPTPTPVH